MIRCPFCLKEVPPGSRHCVGLIGQKGGSARSDRKTAAVRLNAKKGGRRKAADQLSERQSISEFIAAINEVAKE